MTQRAKLYAINDHVTMIDDAGESTCYIVEGSEKAAVIDTVNGRENLMEIVRTVTKKPLVVINTHGHIDHVLGNIYFEEAYLNKEDWQIYHETFEYDDVKSELVKMELKPCPVKDIQQGDKIDLGGHVLEIYAVKGHTPGTIVLLDRKDRILYSGDAVNGQVWMQLPHSTDIPTYVASLEALAPIRDAFDDVYSGHGITPYDNAHIDALLAAAKEIVAGKTENDDKYPWFDGMAPRHTYQNGEKWILYKR